MERTEFLMAFGGEGLYDGP